MPEPTEPTAYKYGLCEGCGKIFVRRYETQKYCTMLCNPKKQKKVDRKKRAGNIHYGDHPESCCRTSYIRPVLRKT